ncbi:ribosomal protein S18 [Absidia repens]|uniref:Small ribosomal subunit protein bS18m n=1 Tax=Absidia repens TaxID=90262 RepID=A0A1X2IBR9_9FUNG|nr:ribosomal protein S18 [Absidia repens]
MLSNLKTAANRLAISQSCALKTIHQRYFSTTFIRQEQDQQSRPSKSIERDTLLLLKNSVSKEKSKPVENVGQRYQKMHHAGDIYHPQDLNDARYQDQLRQRRGRPNPPTEDPFDVLGLDPLHEYKNYRLLSHFVSDMGKILPREKTGLTAKNQRKLAKAVKRARAMGIMSSTSKAPSSGFSGQY